MPGILVVLHKILPNLSLFDLSLAFVLVSLVLGAIGWGFLAGRLSGNRVIGVIGGIGVFVAPWHWISAFGLSEVSAVLAQALTPWVLLAYARISNFHFAKANETFPISNLLLSAAAFALLLLTNTTAAIPAVLGIFLIQFIVSGLKFTVLKRVLAVLFIGWILTLWWYHPQFWVTTFLAPSIGGKSAVSAFVGLINQMRGFVPVVLGIIFIFWGIKPKTLYAKFTLGWLGLFGLLTLFRFMADPDFWLDWTAWVNEVEVGLALLIGYILSQFLLSKKRSTSLLLGVLPVLSFPSVLARTFVDVFTLKSFTVVKKKFSLRAVGNPSRTVTPRSEFVEGSSFSKWLLALLIIIFIVGWIVVWQKRDFWLPRKNIEDTVEYKIANWFSNNSPTVFLSGTTAFWLNSLVDVAQVRGGRDEASVDGRWREAAWEIREGAIAEDTERVLRALSIDYIVIHSDKSGEFYHDFKFPGKFEGISGLEKVYDEKGDKIYNIKY